MGCFGSPSEGAAKKQVGLLNTAGADANMRAGEAWQTEFPFLRNELTNPQGYGQDTINKMNTISGQATAGGLGAGREAALLHASRTGNSASIPALIDSSMRNAMGAESGNALDIQVQNAKLKEAQRQAASSGLTGLYGQNEQDMINALNGGTGAINAWTNAAGPNPFLATLGLAEQGAATGAKIAGG